MAELQMKTTGLVNPPRRSHWMAETPEDRARFEAEGRESVVRLKMPREGVCRFDDLIRGTVEVEWAREQDQVIRRADGTGLYHLASVVDDHTTDCFRAHP